MKTPYRKTLAQNQTKDPHNGSNSAELYTIELIWSIFFVRSGGRCIIFYLSLECLKIAKQAAEFGFVGE